MEIILFLHLNFGLIFDLLNKKVSMKKVFLSIALLSFFSVSKAQLLYKATSSEVGFFSFTPMEDIKATNKESQSIINTSNNDVAVIIGIRAFHFSSALMEEHFNENYMESDKFKLSIFKGKINEKIDFNADFKQEVTATGTLEIHGVVQNRIISGMLIKNGSQITLTSKFKVALKDFKIQIPKVVGNSIAEEIEITAKFVYEPKQK